MRRAYNAPMGFLDEIGAWMQPRTGELRKPDRSFEVVPMEIIA